LREFQTAALVEIGDFGLGCPGCDVGSDSCFVVVFRNDLNGLNTTRSEVSDCTLSSEPREIQRAYVNGSDVYWENMVTMILFTISTLVLSSAVISMKTFLVLRVIFEWSPLIIGGREQTVLFES
jgi:hypothetical protein